MRPFHSMDVDQSEGYWFVVHRPGAWEMTMRTFSSAAGRTLWYRRLMVSIRCRRGVTLNESTQIDGAPLTATEAAERIRLLLSCGF